MACGNSIKTIWKVCGENFISWRNLRRYYLEFFFVLEKGYAKRKGIMNISYHRYAQLSMKIEVLIIMCNLYVCVCVSIHTYITYIIHETHMIFMFSTKVFILQIFPNIGLKYSRNISIYFISISIRKQCMLI